MFDNPSRIQLPQPDVPVPSPTLPAAPIDLSKIKGLTTPSPVTIRKGFAQAPDPGDPRYKMGVGERIMGMIANFASGMRGGNPLVYTGKGALNHQYDFDRYKWEQGLRDARTQYDNDKYYRGDDRENSITPPASSSQPDAGPDNSAPVRHLPPPRLVQTRAHRVGDTVHYHGQPHVVQAVNSDGSIHIAPVSGPADGFLRT